jgi:hypothetical protein
MAAPLVAKSHHLFRTRPKLAPRFNLASKYSPEKTMNPLSFIASPVTDLTKAITYPFKMVFVVGICALVNYMTSPGVWWVQWVAFGMGIGLIAVWFRALKTLIATIGVAAIGYFIYRWWKNRREPEAVARTLAEVKPLFNRAAI